VHHDLGYAFLLCPLQNRVCKRTFEQVGQNGNEIKAHGAKVMCRCANFKCADKAEIRKVN
jgi:hypothetical protein